MAMAPRSRTARSLPCLALLACALALSANACANRGMEAPELAGDGGSGVGGGQGNGGSVGSGSGGSSPIGAGGMGGSITGRAGAPGAGGSAGSGVGGTAGAKGSGGLSGAGGVTSSGGVTGSGGVTTTGGVTGSGGVTTTGGATGSGGVTTTGGVTGSGGVTTGGVTGSGGVTTTGGATGSGGVTTTGGTTGSGGAAGSGGGAAGSGGGAAGSGGGAAGAGGSAAGTTGSGGAAGKGGSAGSGAAGAGMNSCPLGGTLDCSSSGALKLTPDGLVTDFSAPQWNSTSGQWCDADGLRGNVFSYSAASPSTATAAVDTTAQNLKLDLTVGAAMGYAGGGLIFESCVNASGFTKVSFTAALTSGSLTGCTWQVQLQTQDQRPSSDTNPSGGTCKPDAGGASCYQYPAVTGLTAPTATAAAYTEAFTAFSNPTMSTIMTRTQVTGIQWQVNSASGTGTCTAEIRVDNVEFQ
jgi:hypothetical protein